MRLRGSLDRVRSMLELVFGAERLTCIVRAICFAVFVLRKASENALYTLHAPSRAFQKALLETSCPFSYRRQQPMPQALLSQVLQHQCAGRLANKCCKCCAQASRRSGTEKMDFTSSCGHAM